MVALQLDFANAQVVAVSTSSAQSAVFATQAVVRVSTTTACWIKVGTNPTAVANTAGNIQLPASDVVDLIVPAGERIAVIRVSADGHLSIAPILNTRG